MLTCIILINRNTTRFLLFFVQYFHFGGVILDRARLFKNGNNKIVYANEVKEGLYDRHANFQDIEYEFRVTYVNSAKNHGVPYFKLYLSKDDYRKLSPELRTKYDILCELRHWQNGPWHRSWQDKFNSFCKIEQYIKNMDTGKYKYADAYYEEKKICIEFQHSYIDSYFEERNEFYNALGIKVVWLYDLTNLEVKNNNDGTYEILEDNAKGFFRIAEKEENLKNSIVLIHAKNKKIYRINELLRKEIKAKELKSTIRCFKPVSIYDEDEFVQRIKNADNKLLNLKVEEEADTLYHLWELYNPRVARFKNTETGWYFQLNMNPSDQYNSFGKVRGNISSDQYSGFSSSLEEIYGANKKKWILVWMGTNKESN